MDKVLQRVKRAERVAIKRGARRRKAVEGAEAWDRNQNRQRITAINNERIREARKNRQLDWLAGPLAPRRDVGDQALKYGTTAIFDVMLPKRHPRDQKWMPIDKGDRVVITHGRDRGKIGYVLEAKEEEQSVAVRGLNMTEIFVPEWARRTTQSPAAISSNPQNVPVEWVKLVYPLPDPITGIPRDVVIDRLEKVRVRPQGETETERRTDARLIPGTNTIIPWPELPEKEEEEDFEDDTLRVTVDDVTFRPNLLYPPMPITVIDELRNKYSRFRTRHDWDYVQKKEAEAEREERRKQLGKTMRTPLQELAELRARQKAAEARELSDEQLAKIGEVMARERANTTNAVAAQQ